MSGRRRRVVHTRIVEERNMLLNRVADLELELKRLKNPTNEEDVHEEVNLDLFAADDLAVAGAGVEQPAPKADYAFVDEDPD